MYTHFDANKIKEYVRKLNYEKVDNCKTTYFSKERLSLEGPFKEFMEHISKHILVFVTQIQNKTNFSFTGYWFQTYNYEDSMDMHTHGSDYSLIYYVQSSVNSGVTRFYNPGFPYISFNKIDIKPEDNKLVIFPSELLHRVLSNKDKERIIFSANFKVE